MKFEFFKKHIVVIAILCMTFKAEAANKLKFLENLKDLNSCANPDADDYVTANDSLKLHYIAFLNVNAEDSLLFYHGGGANVYAGYTKFAESLARSHNLNVYLFDIRGHGLSNGRRGDTPTVGSPWEDISTAINFIKNKHKGRLLLGGHSSGAGLVLNYMNWGKKNKNIDGIVLIAPQFGHTVDTRIEGSKEIKFARVSILKIFINKLTAGYAFGHDYAVFFNYEGNMAKENNLVTAYTVNMALSVTPDNAEKSLKQLNINTLILLAKEDELLDCSKLQKFLYKVHGVNPKIQTKVLERGGHITCLLHSNQHLSFD